MNQDRAAVSQAAVRIMRDHVECYLRALTSTLAQMGVPSPRLQISPREPSITATSVAPELDLELVVRGLAVDQVTLDRAIRRAAPDCLLGGMQQSSHPCLVDRAGPSATGVTVVAPLPARQDQTVPGALKARHEDTIKSPLRPSASAVHVPPRPDPLPESTIGEARPEAGDLDGEASPIHIAPRPMLQKYNASELLKLAGIILVIFIGLRSVMQTFRVDGPSMNPNFESGQTLIVNRLAYWYVNGSPFEGLLPVRPQGSIDFVFGGPQRGDVVVFRPPGDSNFEEDLIKRVIGLPGESVSIQAGTVIVNGNRLAEPYVSFPADYTFPGEGLAFRVPADSYFVLGDNRPESSDSHLGWVVTAEKLVGAPVISYWPPSRWGLVSRGDVRIR